MTRFRNFGFIARVSTAIGALAIGLALIAPSLGSQGSCIMPTTGTVTGLTLVNDINACNDSVLSLYSGASAPSSPTTGMLWLDTSASPGRVRQYDGSAWPLIWTVDAANHLIIAGIGGGTATLASAATTDVGSIPQSVISISGTATITSFGSSAVVGSVHVLIFQGSATITRNVTSLIVPGIANIVTQAGDVAFATYLGGGNWQIISYTRAAGTAIVNPSVYIGTTLYGDFFSGLPAGTVYGAGQAITRASYPDYLAKVTRTQSAIRSAGNAVLTSVGQTTGMGVGMPVEGTGINGGCTIASTTSSTITLNSSACVTSSGTANITVFSTGYGLGGDSTTVGVKDCQARALVGRDAVLGTPTNRITNAISGINALQANSGGGNQKVDIGKTNLPSYNLDITGLTGSSSLTQTIYAYPNQANLAGGGGAGADAPVLNGRAQAFISSTTFGGNIPLGGSGQSLASMNPVVTGDCVVVVSQ